MLESHTSSTCARRRRRLSLSALRTATPIRLIWPLRVPHSSCYYVRRVSRRARMALRSAVSWADRRLRQVWQVAYRSSPRWASLWQPTATWSTAELPPMRPLGHQHQHQLFLRNPSCLWNFHASRVRVREIVASRRRHPLLLPTLLYGSFERPLVRRCLVRQRRRIQPRSLTARRTTSCLRPHQHPSNLQLLQSLCFCCKVKSSYNMYT